MTNYSERLDEILQDYGLEIYKFKLYEPSAEWGAEKYKAKQALKSLISKAYISGLTDATADPSTMTSKEVFERNQRINEHSERSQS